MNFKTRYFRWAKNMFEFYRETLDWRNRNTPKYWKTQWRPGGCGT